MRLFVDDTRAFPPSGFQCCRDSKSAKLLLSVMTFDFITLDYHLGSESDNGLELLKWMKENGITVPKINIHSNHTEGRRLMKEYATANFPESIITMNMLEK